MLICEVCWEPYRGNNHHLQDGDPCPRRECAGTIWDIDEMLLPTIILLNEKGYATSQCCSGHFHSKTYAFGYISFGHYIEAPCLGIMPSDKFQLEEGDRTGVVIRWRLHSADQYELHGKILETSIELLNWAIGLKVLPE
jgi:hypothetical protein